MTETQADQAKLQRAAAALNPYGKRTSKPEPGQTWRVRVPRSEKCDGEFDECDAVVVTPHPMMPIDWSTVQVGPNHFRYVHQMNMLHMIASAPVRISGYDTSVLDHDATCHYRIAAIAGTADKCPHGCDDALDCEHCYPCTCSSPERQAA